MKKTENIAIQNKNEAQGNCLACNRPGIPVFLLRKAVIKTKSMQTDGINPTFQELAHYTKTLDFKNRMPDEQLNGFDYILRTLRNGYVYVMQQQGDDINSRIFQVYECIDGALRLKNIYDLTNTEPRPLSKACKDACHYIPASFISLQPQFTQAWVAYTSQPWNPKTIEDYLKEQDHTVLSRFTKIDIKKLKDTPSEATGNRAVPFKDIFGFSHEDPANDKSKVLEFRFDDQGLNDFESAHRFTSFKKERKRFALHANLLYKGYKPISCGVVLEDTFGIAEELNTQRVKNLSLFHNQAQRFADDEIKIDDDFNAGFDIDKQNKIFEQRAQSMLKMINPVLQRRFKYYQPIMFKKRIILQLIEQYRLSVETSYDREIEKLRKTVEKYNKPKDKYDYYGTPSITKEHMQLGDLIADKKNALEDIDKCINQEEVGIFKDELEAAYNEVVDYCKEYSKDYFTYVRWLFGDREFTSKFCQSMPSSFNDVRFWLYEFDFTSIESIQNHTKEVTNILIDSTHCEIKLDEDNALWDELLSNPKSIFYVITHINIDGINLAEKNFVDLNTNNEMSWNDVISRSANIALINNKFKEDQIKKEAEEKQKILAQRRHEIEEKIKTNQEELAALEQEEKAIPHREVEKHKELQQKKRQNKREIQKLKENLKNVNQQLSARNPTGSPYAKELINAHHYLNDVSLNKYSRLAKDKKITLIKPRYHQLHLMHHLAQLKVYPIEINVNIWPQHIAPTIALLSQMNRSFYGTEGFSVQEQKFLSQFETVDEKLPAGENAGGLKKLKLMMFLPDLEVKNVIAAYIKGLEKNILKPNELANVLKTTLKEKVNLVQTKAELEAKIEQHKRQQQTTIEDLKQDNSREKTRQILNKEIEKLEDILNQNQQAQGDLNKTTRNTTIDKHRSSVKTAKTGFAINIMISGVVGAITLNNLWENLKEWGKPKEGEGEMQLDRQLVTNLVSLVLMGIDLTTQYRDIKFKMQQLKATQAGTGIVEIESRMALNNIIMKTVARAFAAITVLDAIGELKSAFDMVNMENKSYLIARVAGAFGLGVGAVFLAAGTTFAFVVGIVMLVAGTIMILFSKKYDNYTPIQHWLNCCCFGKQEELEYLKDSAYHEEDYSDHSGFGRSVNDYMIVIYGIETFVRLKPLYNPPQHSYPANYYDKNTANAMQRHIYFYVNIAEFAENNPNESLTAHIRLQPNDSKYIEFKYNVTTQGITLMQIQESSGHNDYIITDINDYAKQYEKTDSTRSYPIIKTNVDITKFDEFSLVKSPELDHQELIINKWMGGTVGYNQIKKYQILIQYNHREEIPLIITKNGKI